MLTNIKQLSKLKIFFFLFFSVVESSDLLVQGALCSNGLSNYSIFLYSADTFISTIWWTFSDDIYVVECEMKYGMVTCMSESQQMACLFPSQPPSCNWPLLSAAVSQAQICTCTEPQLTCRWWRWVTVLMGQEAAVAQHSNECAPGVFDKLRQSQPCCQEPVLLGLQLVLFLLTCMVWYLLVPVLALVDLTWDHWVTRWASVNEGGPSVISVLHLLCVTVAEQRHSVSHIHC